VRTHDQNRVLLAAEAPISTTRPDLGRRTFEVTVSRRSMPREGGPKTRIGTERAHSKLKGEATQSSVEGGHENSWKTKTSANSTKDAPPVSRRLPPPDRRGRTSSESHLAAGLAFPPPRAPNGLRIAADPPSCVAGEPAAPVHPGGAERRVKRCCTRGPAGWSRTRGNRRQAAQPVCRSLLRNRVRTCRCLPGARALVPRRPGGVGTPPT